MKILSRAIKISQFKKNVISASFIHGLNIGIVLISYPLYIHYLGFKLFSVWSLLSIVISFALIGDFGISKALVKYISESSEDKEYIQKIIVHSYLIIICISILIGLFLNIGSSLIIRWLNIPPEYQSSSIEVIYLMSLFMLSYLLFDCNNGVISAFNRLDISSIFLLFLNILRIIISVVMLQLNMGLKSLILGVGLANIILIFAQLIVIQMKFKITIFHMSKFKMDIIKKLMSFGSTIISMQIFNMFSIPLVKIFISHRIGIDQVGFFELASKLVYSIRTIFEKGLFAIMPRIGEKYGSLIKIDKSEVYDEIRIINTNLLKISIPFFILVILIVPFGIPIWLGNNFHHDVLQCFYFLLPGVLVGLIALPSYYSLMALNYHHYCLYEAVIRVILLFVFFFLFSLLTLNLTIVSIIFSITVVMSNMFIILIFRKLFPRKRFEVL